MILSRLYSNKPDKFTPVEFVPGLNVLKAEIYLPENLNKVALNLGQTMLGCLVDFCFLSPKDNSFFEHFDYFFDFVFFLELELANGSYVTIRRPVEAATKISFKCHEAGHQDFSAISLTEWDHQNLTLESARDLLGGLLDIQAIKPRSYSDVLGYVRRSQEDFCEVFQFQKFAFKHANWQPFLVNLLGFNAQLTEDLCKLEQHLSDKLIAEKTLKRELDASFQDISTIEGLLLLKQKEAEKKQSLLDAFDFRFQDKELTKKLVHEVDEQIAGLNAERYCLSLKKKKVQSSLQDDQILFNPDEAQRLFSEAGVLFQGQIKKDFQQLIAFNKAITIERRDYLQVELTEIEKDLKRINAELDAFGKKRSEMLSFLSETDVFNKYKQFSEEIVKLRADMAALEIQRGHWHRLRVLRSEIRTLNGQYNHLQIQIEDDVENNNSDQESLFSTIRVFFSEIVEEIIDRKAVLSVVPDKAGHLEFKAEIVDESGKATRADLGPTYRKLLGAAFDLAVMRAHLDEKFPRFVFHDRVLESLDDQEKKNLMTVVRRYADWGLQQVFTLVASDWPVPSEVDDLIFAAS